MKLILAAIMVLMPAASVVATGTSCVVPSFESTHFAESVSPEQFPPSVDMPGIADAIGATGTGNAVSMTVSLIASGTTQVAQGTRANSILQIASCKNASSAQGSQSWMDSPTQLSIGSSSQQYDLGALVGNWALLGGTAAAWSLAAYRYGTATVRFPGGLAMPVLFLMAPTVTSAVSLLRDGTATQRLLGGCSLTAQVLGTGLVAVFVHPSYFGARWATEDDESKWVDGREKNYVKHYGMLFEDYREGRHWFITGELLVSMAMGSIKSYLATDGNCKPVVTTAAAVSLAYALSLITLHPNLERKERVFYGAIAGLEAAALTLQAISLWTASEETQQKTRAAAGSIVMAVEWALFAKTLFDVGNRIGSAYRYLRSKSETPLPLAAPLLSADAAQQDSVNIGKVRSSDLFMPDPIPDQTGAPVLEVPVPVVSPSSKGPDLSDISLAERLQVGSPWVDPNNPNPLNEIVTAEEGLL